MVVDIEHMRAVVIRWAVAAAQILRIVSVVVQAQRALLIEGSGKCIGETGLQSVAHAFFNVRLQSIVGRNPAAV